MKREIFDLNDLNVIVTGAANGNGKVISEALFDRGANIIAIDKKNINFNIKPRKKNTYEKFKCNLENEKDLYALINRIKKRYNRIDVLINNAGITLQNKNKVKVWQKTLNINLKAPYILISEISLLMKKYKKGSIINITSLSQKLAFSNNPSYNSSKAALSMLTNSFAMDLGKFNIRVNNIAPGYIKTSMTKKSYNNKKKYDERKNRTMLNRWGESSDLIGAVIFLASDASSYVTSTEIYVDGGWSKKGI